jgi:hypothetical protein
MYVRELSKPCAVRVDEVHPLVTSLWRKRLPFEPPTYERSDIIGADRLRIEARVRIAEHADRREYGTARAPVPCLKRCFRHL